jgi:hypothetical protein
LIAILNFFDLGFVFLLQYFDNCWLVLILFILNQSSSFLQLF